MFEEESPENTSRNDDFLYNIGTELRVKLIGEETNESSSIFSVGHRGKQNFSEEASSLEKNDPREEREGNANITSSPTQCSLPMNKDEDELGSLEIKKSNHLKQASLLERHKPRYEREGIRNKRYSPTKTCNPINSGDENGKAATEFRMARVSPGKIEKYFYEKLSSLSSRDRGHTKELNSAIQTGNYMHHDEEEQLNFKMSITTERIKLNNEEEMVHLGQLQRGDKLHSNRETVRPPILPVTTVNDQDKEESAMEEKLSVGPHETREKCFYEQLLSIDQGRHIKETRSEMLNGTFINQGDERATGAVKVKPSIGPQYRRKKYFYEELVSVDQGRNLKESLSAIQTDEKEAPGTKVQPSIAPNGRHEKYFYEELSTMEKVGGRMKDSHSATETKFSVSDEGNKEQPGMKVKSFKESYSRREKYFYEELSSIDQGNHMKETGSATQSGNSDIGDDGEEISALKVKLRDEGIKQKNEENLSSSEHLNLGEELKRNRRNMRSPIETTNPANHYNKEEDPTTEEQLFIGPHVRSRTDVHLGLSPIGQERYTQEIIKKSEDSGDYADEKEASAVRVKLGIEVHENIQREDNESLAFLEQKNKRIELDDKRKRRMRTLLQTFKTSNNNDEGMSATQAIPSAASDVSSETECSRKVGFIKERLLATESEKSSQGDDEGQPSEFEVAQERSVGEKNSQDNNEDALLSRKNGTIGELEEFSNKLHPHPQISRTMKDNDDQEDAAGLQAKATLGLHGTRAHDFLRKHFTEHIEEARFPTESSRLSNRDEGQPLAVKLATETTECRQEIKNRVSLIEQNQPTIELEDYTKKTHIRTQNFTLVSIEDDREETAMMRPIVSKWQQNSSFLRCHGKELEIDLAEHVEGTQPPIKDNALVVKVVTKTELDKECKKVNEKSPVFRQIQSRGDLEGNTKKRNILTQTVSPSNDNKPEEISTTISKLSAQRDYQRMQANFDASSYKIGKSRESLAPVKKIASPTVMGASVKDDDQLPSVKVRRQRGKLSKKERTPVDRRRFLPKRSCREKVDVVEPETDECDNGVAGNGKSKRERQRQEKIELEASKMELDTDEQETEKRVERDVKILRKGTEKVKSKKATKSSDKVSATNSKKIRRGAGRPRKKAQEELSIEKEKYSKAPGRLHRKATEAAKVKKCDHNNEGVLVPKPRREPEKNLKRKQMQKQIKLPDSHYKGNESVTGKITVRRGSRRPQRKVQMQKQIVLSDIQYKEESASYKRGFGSSSRKANEQEQIALSGDRDREDESVSNEFTPRRGRGRPRKRAKMQEQIESSISSEVTPRRGRGRPLKRTKIQDKIERSISSEVTPRRGSGRRSKGTKVQEKIGKSLTSEVAPRRGPGRPPKRAKMQEALKLSDNCGKEESVSDKIAPRRGQEGRPPKRTKIEEEMILSDGDRKEKETLFVEVTPRREESYILEHEVNDQVESEVVGPKKLKPQRQIKILKPEGNDQRDLGTAKRRETKGPEKPPKKVKAEISIQNNEVADIQSSNAIATIESEKIQVMRTKLPSIQCLYKNEGGLLSIIRKDVFCKLNMEHGSTYTIVLKVLEPLCYGNIPHLVQAEMPFLRPLKEVMQTSFTGGQPPQSRFYGVVRFDDCAYGFAIQSPQLNMISEDEQFTLPGCMTTRGQEILLRAGLDEFVAGQLYVFVIRLLYGKHVVNDMHKKLKTSESHIQDVLLSFGVEGRSFRNAADNLV